MAALTNPRNTPELADDGRTLVYPVEANTTVYLGSIVALNANGNATPAASVAGLKILGRAEMMSNGIPGQDAVNNPGAAGAISIVTRRGVFPYAVNDGSIAAAQVGLVAFAVDDNSVSASDGSAAVAVVAQSTTFPRQPQRKSSIWATRTSRRSKYTAPRAAGQCTSKALTMWRTMRRG